MTIMARMFAGGLALLALATAGWADEVERRITVTGEGRVVAVPDMAVLRLGVTEDDRAPEAAMAAVGTRIEAVFAGLSGLGVAARDMETTGLSLMPVWERQTPGAGEAPRVAGYRASTQVTVRVRAMDSLGAVMEAALEAGANEFQGISFAVAEPRPLETEARKAAVADARARAETYAAAAGVTLGPVLRIDETGGYVPGPQPFAMAEARAVPVAAGEAEISVQVTVVYGLE